MIVIVPWRSMVTDLSAVNIWAGSGLRAAEAHAL